MIISYPPAHSFEHLSILRCQPTNPPAICASILPSPTTYFFPSHPASTSTQLFILLDHRLINRPPPFDRPTERTIHTPNHPSCTPPSHRNSRPASSIHTFHRTIDIDHPNQILHPTPSGRLRDKRVLNRSPPPPPPGLPPHLLPCAHSLPLLQPPLETNRPSNSVHSIIPLVLIYYPPPRYSHCSV